MTGAKNTVDFSFILKNTGASTHLESLTENDKMTSSLKDIIQRGHGSLK